MDMHNRDSSGSHSNMPELRLILVGNIGCGKTLTADTLLNESSSVGELMPSRLSEVRGGVSEGRHLKVVETPRWYWRGEHIDTTVQRETEKALSLVSPGPHAFLILVPVGQFTEMEGRIPTELERVFGKGALEHSLVLLTCGDYLIGRDHERYLNLDEPGLRAMVNGCGGHWHVINNRRPENRQQVISLLEKVEQLSMSSGGCYLPSGMRKEEHEVQRRSSLREELVHPDHTTLTQTTWSKEETLDESGRRKIKVRSMGPAAGRVVSQQLANGLHSQSWYEDSTVGQKHSSFKLSKEGAILSQLSELKQPVKTQNKQNFINTIHYDINTMGDISSAPPSSPSPTASITSYPPSANTFSSLSSSTYSSSSAADVAPSSSTTLFSSPTAFSTSSYTSSYTDNSTYSSTTFYSSPTKTSFSPSFNTGSSSSSSKTFFSSSSTPFSSASPQTSITSSFSSTTFSSSNPSFSSSSTTFSSSSPPTNTSYLSSSSSTGTNVSILSSSTTLSPSSTPASASSLSSSSSNELRLVLLGRTGSGKSAAGNAILGRDEFKLRRDDATGPTTQSCVKGTAVIGQKQVAVVDTPDWFFSSCPPEKLANHLSSCMDLCAPGPHAFLLCVPITLPGRTNLHDLSTIRNLFGPDATLRHTLVLFTHSDHLKDGNIEEYIAAKRPELLDLVEKCSDRFHVLKHGKNGGNIEQLLEKVEQAVKESSGNHYSYQEPREIGRERMTQVRRGRGGEDDVDRALTSTLHSLREEEEVEQEEKNVKPLESSTSTVTSVLGSILQFVGQKVAEGAKQVPKLVAGGAVLGGVFGLYVGGPVGGAVGATAGSVAAEYGRRQYNKPKTD